MKLWAKHRWFSRTVIGRSGSIVEGQTFPCACKWGHRLYRLLRGW